MSVSATNAMTIEEGTKAFEELNGQFRCRSELSETEEKEYVARAFKIYEDVGFEETLPDIQGYNEEDVPYIGKPFKVIARCGAPGWDVTCLPAWTIEFPDGHKMDAYPEEICILERWQR